MEKRFARRNGGSNVVLAVIPKAKFFVTSVVRAVIGNNPRMHTGSHCANWLHGNFSKFIYRSKNQPLSELTIVGSVTGH